MKPILSIRDLAWRLRTPPNRLQAIAKDIKQHYTYVPLVDKERQIARHLWIPSEELKEIQRRINKLLALIILPEVVHGGVRGRSPRSNAGKHLCQPWVVNVDVKRFFPNVRHRFVFHLFRNELNFGRDVARLLTRLTTFRDQLPQGAPTSTIVANLLLAVPVDGPISVEAQRIGATYTRFVDDITFSGAEPRPLINIVGRLLSSRGLTMWREHKLKITRSSKRQEVTGLIVNSVKGPTVSRQRRANVRAAIFALRSITNDVELHRALNSVRGRIAHIREFNQGAAKRLQRYLDVTTGAI